MAQAVTKKMLDEAVEEIAVVTHNAMGEIRNEMNEMNDKFKHFESSQAAILDVVRSINEQLREHKNLPARVERLERAVFR